MFRRKMSVRYTVSRVNIFVIHCAFPPLLLLLLLLLLLPLL
jgi:hypothetical protein